MGIEITQVALVAIASSKQEISKAERETKLIQKNHPEALLIRRTSPLGGMRGKIVLPYAKYKTVDSWINSSYLQEKFPLVPLIDKIIACIEELHAANVISHDIKPENLLIGEHRVYLLDRGLSTEDAERDLEYQSKGTPLYLPPECYVPTSYAGKAQDIYTLGATFFNMLLKPKNRFLSWINEAQFRSLFGSTNYYLLPKKITSWYHGYLRKNFWWKKASGKPPETWRQLFTWMTHPNFLERPTIGEVREAFERFKNPLVWDDLSADRAEKILKESSGLSVLLSRDGDNIRALFHHPVYQKIKEIKFKAAVDARDQLVRLAAKALKRQLKGSPSALKSFAVLSPFPIGEEGGDAALEVVAPQT